MDHCYHSHPSGTLTPYSADSFGHPDLHLFYVPYVKETFLCISESKAKYSSQREAKAGHFEDFGERLDSYADTVKAWEGQTWDSWAVC